MKHEEFMEKFYKKNKNAKNIEILEEYKGCKTKIKCRCKIDGYEWEVLPSSLLRESGCPKCSNVYRRTHEEFIQEIKEINPNIEILNKYKNVKTKIKCRCKIDGYEWNVRASSLLEGTGCPKCSGKNKRTHEEFIQEIKEINDDIEILGKYVNRKTKIKCRCKIDGYIWEATPTQLLNNKSGCPKCGIKSRTEKRTKTHEQFIEEMKIKNSDIEILGIYVNKKTKIKCRCKIDGYEWEVTPMSLLNGNGCHKCNTTKGEKRIVKYLDNRNIYYIYDKPYFKDLKSNNNKILRPDFIIENMKIWIEFDGIQHFEPVDFANRGKEWAEENFKTTQENDKLKNKYAKEHNWKLIRIAYYDFDRIEEILNTEMGLK